MGFRVLFLGDVVGDPGLAAVERWIGPLREETRADRVIVNGENACGGSGITASQFGRLELAGADGVTLGDHVYKRAAIMKTFDASRAISVPANLPPGAKGRRWLRVDAGGPELFVVTLLGRIFMTLPADDPFACIDAVLARLPSRRPLVIVEVHAEATSEKFALRWHMDGRVAAVVGTHTHVATADAEVSAAGTAYQSDLGMCGPHDGVIGRRADRVLKYMTTAMPAPFDVAEGDVRVNGTLIEIDPATGRALSIERIERRG